MGHRDCEAQPTLRFFEGPRKAFKGKRLFQVVDRFQFVAFQRVVGVGGGEDDQRRGLQGPHEGESGELWHLDIEKDQVDALFLMQRLASLHGIAAFAHDFQEAQVPGKILNDPMGQRFVVDD